MKISWRQVFLSLHWFRFFRLWETGLCSMPLVSFGFLPVRDTSFGICGWRNGGFLFGWWYAHWHWQNVFTDRVNKTPYIYMSRGEYAFGGILPGVTGPEPAGDRASLRAERVTGYSGSDKYYK